LRRAITDQETCRRLLTSYEAHTIRKLPGDGRQKSTWGIAKLVREPWSQADISTRMRLLSESGSMRRTVTEKKAALFPHQQGQISKLLDDLNGQELDASFEWVLAELDRREKRTKWNKAETI
jgi:hypothetical protein